MKRALCRVLIIITLVQQEYRHRSSSDSIYSHFHIIHATEILRREILAELMLEGP